MELGGDLILNQKIVILKFFFLIINLGVGKTHLIEFIIFFLLKKKGGV